MSLNLIPKLLALTVAITCISGCEGKPQELAFKAEAKTSRAQPPSTVSAPPPTVLISTPSPRIVRRTSLTTAAQPFVFRPDGVFLPGYDDQPSSAGPELMRLAPDVFARTTNVYRGRAICTKPNNETTTFTIPAKATELGMALRGRAVEGEWPRIRISLVDGSRTDQSVVLFEGNIAWRELRYLWWDIPASWRNRLAFLRVTVLNPNYYFAQRAVYIGPTVVRGLE